MRIAISGSAGTGKSTLTQVLAERLQLAAIEENYQPLYDVKSRSDVPPCLIKVLENKQQLENANGRFVVDRCPADLVQIWLFQSGHKINRKLTDTFINRCLQQMLGYDFVIITPWNSLPLECGNGVRPRNMDIMEQLRAHAEIVGQIHMWIPRPRIIEIPRNLRSLDMRVDFVLARIKKRRPELLPAALV